MLRDKLNGNVPRITWLNVGVKCGTDSNVSTSYYYFFFHFVGIVSSEVRVFTEFFRILSCHNKARFDELISVLSFLLTELWYSGSY